MKRKTAIMTAIIAFIVYVVVLPLFIFPNLENQLNAKAMNSFSELKNADIDWNGRTAYLSVSANMDQQTAEATANTIDNIRGVRDVHILYGTDKEVVTSKDVQEKNQVQSVANDILKLGNINFKTDDVAIQADSLVIIDEIAKILNKNKEINIDIIGHTDSIGDEEYNLKLSKERAQTVINVFITKGINEARMFSDGMGESLPIADNDTSEGRQENRRVEIIVRGEN